MHPLHIHDRLSVRGGADIHLLAILSRQAGQHRVSLAVGRAERDVSPPPGVDLYVVPGLGGRQRQGPAAARRLEVLVRELSPSLLHMHNLVQPDVMAAVANWGPAVATVQDHRSFCPGRGMVLPDGQPCAGPASPQACAACFDDPDYAGMITTLTAARTQTLNGFERVVVLSNYMAQQLSIAGIEPERLRVIPPFPWAPSPPSPPVLALPSGPLALASGRLVWAKGFHLLLEAWARARPPLPLVIAGEGPARADLQNQAAQLGLGPDRVIFTGWLPRTAVETLLGRARFSIMPSLWAEPFGIAGLEAQARGVPVLAFDVGGVPDWLHDDHGWLLPPADVEALRAAVQCASDPAEAQRRGHRAARFVAERFDPPELMHRLTDTYREALASGGPQG